MKTNDRVVIVGGKPVAKLLLAGAELLELGDLRPEGVNGAVFVAGDQRISFDGLPVDAQRALAAYFRKPFSIVISSADEREQTVIDALKAQAAAAIEGESNAETLIQELVGALKDSVKWPTANNNRHGTHTVTGVCDCWIARAMEVIAKAEARP